MKDYTDAMKCCPGKWKHDPDCVPCRFCFAGTRRYRGDVPICSDCQQNQATDDYQRACYMREVQAEQDAEAARDPEYARFLRTFRTADDLK